MPQGKPDHMVFEDGRKLTMVLEGKLHTMEVSWNCLLCAASLPNVSGLRHHLLIHLGRPPNSSNVEKHFSKNNGGLSWDCQLCDEVFEQCEDLDFHYLGHTNIKAIPRSIDPDCSLTFCLLTQRQPTDLVRQQLSNACYCRSTLQTELVPPVCASEKMPVTSSNTCFQTSDEANTNKQTSNTRKTHVTSHPGERPVIIDLQQSTLHSQHELFKCEFCDEVFRTPVILRSHWLTHLGANPYKCHLCDKTFQHASHLESHQLMHKIKKTFKCFVCDKAFGHITNLKIHLQEEHRMKESLKSDLGEETCQQASHLENQHWMQLTRPLKCDLCDKAFVRITNLKRHVQEVHKIRLGVGESFNFKCDLCNKAFGLHSQLSIHQLVHTRETPFKCDLCDKAYRHRYHLKRHVKGVHRTKVQIKCDLCGKVFGILSQLKRHMVVHTTEPQFKCKLCDKAYKWAGDLTKHQLTHSQSSEPVNIKFEHFKPI